MVYSIHMSSQKKDIDIFEMILKSTGEINSAASAVVSSIGEKEPDWRVEHQEGQLAIDVGATDKELVIISTIAGADTASIEVYVHSDLLTIRGKRQRPAHTLELEHVYHQECYWGTFSRTVVLPVEVHGELAHAEYANGILTITIPKRRSEAKIPVKIVEE